MIRYLSLDWINALSDEVSASDHMREIAESHSIGVTQVVSDGPEGDVTYHLSVGDGDASFGAGPADPEDVKMEQDWDTAVAVATGELNAQEAFITGRIRLFGDQQKLLDSQPVFGALDSVFSSVRERTSLRLRYDRDTTGDPPLVMPEMPEIQAHAERLTDRFSTRVLTGFTPFNFTALKTAVPAPARGIRTAAARRRPTGQVPAAAVRAGDVRRASHAGRAARARHEAIGETARRAGPIQCSSRSSRPTDPSTRPHCC